ncbi:MAG: heavy metal translocating P-type ATPase metal-binding domain-containing protein [Candidatus Zixiibacteriota bacterium]
MRKTENSVALACAHCGDPCNVDSPRIGDKYFCCPGCKTVYELLHQHELDSYYAIEQTPGIRPGDSKQENRFAYLDDETIRGKILDFSDGSSARVTFSVPQIHCSSCIWLLENLHRLNSAILSSQVDFPRREATILFRIADLSLSDLVRLMASIGYEPDITLADLNKTGRDTSFRRLYTQLAIAGFCFGNVMLLSFPEYLGLDVSNKPAWTEIFGYLNILLALPVFLYCASDYFRSAYHGLRQRQINMDVPIALGISILFSRSLYNILALKQAGYMDSLCALVFLLLVGRLYQKKTYHSLSFDRDYRSYLPISVMRLKSGIEENIGLTSLAVGDRIRIRNRELVPADSILISGEGHIDYSFVTGESEPVAISSGQRVYAGGRQIGAAIELDVIKEPSQSYLMQLWTQTAKAIAEQPGVTTLANKVSRIFTPSIIFVAFAAAFYWRAIDPSRALDAATAVLIIACPCALALSTPFALGTIHRIFGRAGLFLQSPDVIERMASISKVVFDKTGTITQTGTSVPVFEGDELTEKLQDIIFAVVRQSTHPLSQAIADSITSYADYSIEDFIEVPGLGLEARVGGHSIKTGSREWVGLEGEAADINTARVYIAIDGRVIGFYRFAGQYRPQLQETIETIGRQAEIALLTGDSDGERDNIRALFGGEADIRFRQSPQDKLAFVSDAMKSGEQVLMIGDGLNDAGALKSASVGISIMENHSSFSPACDGILEAESFAKLPRMMKMAKTGVTIIKTSFVISFFYNILGLAFAVQGLLSPVIAAVLMPASSISVVVFTTITSALAARKRGL